MSLGQNWYKSNHVVGMMLYVDLFSDNLENLINKIPYLSNLGITLVHLMPLLKSRKGNNDGGYAVLNYLEVDSKFGNMQQLDKIVSELKKYGIHTCIDFVLNHTAKEHEWAIKAQQGDSKYQDMYYFYDDKDIVSAYEKNMVEIFPKMQPGNFTYYKELNKYVMTRFYEFQWDLNYKNSTVLKNIIEITLKLANHGIDMLRMDAVPYMGKKIGEASINMNEVHLLLKLINCVVKYACSSVVLLGEAIVEPHEIVKYFGDDTTSECEVLYNATMMVSIWNSIATRNTNIMTETLEKKYNTPSNSVWINYARCHDDIGWGLDYDIVAKNGLDPFLHKQFLIKYFTGEFEGSISKGEIYEFNPETLDGRNSGTLASLCGLEKAIENKNESEIKLAIDRILLVHSLIISYSGIPMLYSGDEVGALNNWEYKKNKDIAKDSRWLHRQKFNWDVLNSLEDENTYQSIIFNSIKNMIRLRCENEIFSSDNTSLIKNIYDSRIFVFEKSSKLFGFFNFSSETITLNPIKFKSFMSKDKYLDLLQDKLIYVNKGFVLKPYQSILFYDKY